LESIQKAKSEFVHSISQANAEVLSVIDARAKAEADSGNLDGYKRLEALSAEVKADIVLPDGVTDTEIRSAYAKFLETAHRSYDKLRIVYSDAVRQYTKARQIPQAEAVQAELNDGGWFQSFTGRPSTIDLLKAIDIERDTIRKGWQFNDGVLESAGWDDDHGPLIQIPVSVQGSYEMRMEYSLAISGEAIYVTVPIGQDHWGTFALADQFQDFDNVNNRELQSHKTVTLGQKHIALLEVSCSDDSVSLLLKIDGSKAIEWSGPYEGLTNHNRGVFSADVSSRFAIDAKSGKIFSMTVSAK
jgi:hypothetical protein